MRKSKWFVIVVLFILISCSIIGTRFAFSRSPDGSKEIMIYLGFFGDASVYMIDISSGRKIHLFGIAFADLNERILKFGWSPNSTKVAWLISSINGSTYGKRLVVFDVAKFPEKVTKALDDSKHNIVDYELFDDRIIYLIAGETTYREHRF